MLVDQLSLAPFDLDTAALAWVKRTREAMTVRQKLQQLFVLAQLVDDPEAARTRMLQKPAGLHRKWGADLGLAWNTTRVALENAEIPPFITGDMEGGGYGALCATQMPNALATAAIADEQLRIEIAEVLARETAAMGFNWSFSPVIDIAANPESAIVGTRSFGSDIKSIQSNALAQARALQANGVAATAKHWPGEGFDRRDQHLVTTVNPLEWDEWEESFGAMYREMFSAGVMTAMVGHIAWPNGARKLNKDIGKRAYAPATVSKELCTGLLRDYIGFKGLIVSDATSMGGLSSWDARHRYLPELIENGCDVILFSKNPEADIETLDQALVEKRLSEARVDEAITRILGLKAALRLHEKSIDERLGSIEEVREKLSIPAHKKVSKRAASECVTLVKDIGILPLTLEKHKRVVVCSRGIETHMQGAQPRPLSEFLNGMRAKGFQLLDYDPLEPPSPANADLVMYLLAKESMMGLSHIEVDWGGLHGGPRQGMRRCWHEVPTVMISFGHPGYLLDAPRVPVYINAYYSADEVQEAVLEKLLGLDQFVGKSPIDAFCGQEEARW